MQKPIYLSVSQFADPRFLQIFLLGSFLIYGWSYLGWYADSLIYFSAVLSCLGTQYLWLKRKALPLSTLRSALISALGLCLLLKVNHWGWMALAGFITISSKFLISHRGKHIFNPTNLGIVVLFLIGQGWISPGQWGSGDLIGSLVVLGASMVLFGVNRWDVALAFLMSLFILESFRSVAYLGWTWDVVFHKFNNGTVLLFAFFMITDPKTSPNSRKGRLIWGGMVALLTFFLTQYSHFYQAPIFALFAVSLLTPLFDRFFIAQTFTWIPQTSKH